MAYKKVVLSIEHLELMGAYVLLHQAEGSLSDKDRVSFLQNQFLYWERLKVASEFSAKVAEEVQQALHSPSYLNELRQSFDDIVERRTMSQGAKLKAVNSTNRRKLGKDVVKTLKNKNLEKTYSAIVDHVAQLRNIQRVAMEDIRCIFFSR